MELGQYQLQVFVSLVVILGAAFVALICDFLQGNNEQLRELTIELKLRRQEEQRRSRTMMAEPSKAGKASPVTAASEPVPAAQPLGAPRERKRIAAPEAMAAMERGAQMATIPKPRKQLE